MKHEAWVSWRLEGDMPSGRYSSAHTLRFDGGAEIAGSPSPDIVPAPWSDATAVDPEEAFVGAISSCHMLWFLDLACRDGWVIETYEDHRMAMSLAVAGLRIPGVQITGEDCVAKSFPDFWQRFSLLTPK